MQTMRIGVGTPLQKAYNKKKCSSCGTKFDIINVELQNYLDGNVVWKKEDIAYCRNCNEFFFRSDYDDFIYKHPGYFDYKLVQHVRKSIEDKEEKKKEKLTEETKKITEIKKEKNDNMLPKANFFVRSSICSCAKKKHNIIDFKAEVDVICPNGDILKKSFLASYCEDCKLYFMYDNEYKRLRKSGVPLCSIFEYSKYIKAKNNGKIELKPESLLHSFGYNVGASENLSSKQRNKILSFVIKNGVMNKHEILYLLNYLVDFRKNDKRQAKAIAKWKMDINYLQNTNIESDKKVEVNSIRITKTIKK